LDERQQQGSGEAAFPGDAGQAATSPTAADAETPSANGESAPAPGEGDLAEQLAAEQHRSAELRDAWQRERADFLNYKRRIETERQREAEFAGAQVVAKTLFVLDDFDLALANRPAAPETEGWVNGVALIAHKMRQMLESEGVQAIPAQGERFDPSRHEAVMMEDGGGDFVVAELRRGYTLRGTVLRPSLVKVGKGQ